MSRCAIRVGLLLLVTTFAGCSVNRSTTWRTSHRQVRVQSVPAYSPPVAPLESTPAAPERVAPEEPTPAEPPVPAAAMDDFSQPSPFEQLMPRDPSPLLPPDVDTTSAQEIQASPWRPKKRVPAEADDFQALPESDAAEEPASAAEELGQGAIASILGRNAGRPRMDLARNRLANDVSQVSYDLSVPGHSAKPR
jgi:hypothetical protein